jgi:hypothetical protein
MRDNSLTSCQMIKRATIPRWRVDLITLGDTNIRRCYRPKALNQPGYLNFKLTDRLCTRKFSCLFVSLAQAGKGVQHETE